MDIDKESEQHIDLPKPHKEYSAEQALREVIRTTENGEVCIALAFLNGMLVAMTMGGKQ